MRLSLLLASSVLLLSGCDQLGIETPAQQDAKVEAEGKAVGSACRQAGRALEDCYQINPKASKSAIFNGWREMDAYMRENKLETVPPEFPMKPPPPKKKAGSTGADESAGGDKKVAEEKPAESKSH